jgi:hypothetical protein
MKPSSEPLMSHPCSLHPLRCRNLHSWTIAILLMASSSACGDDDPIAALPTPSTIEKIAGDGQVELVAQEVPNPLVVRVLDDAGVPLGGVSVAWTAQGGGSVSPETVSTDSDGIAATRRVLGPSAGDQITTAAVRDRQGLEVAFTTVAEAYQIPRIPTTPSQARLSH